MKVILLEDVKSLGKKGGLFQYLYKLGDAYDKTKKKGIK